MAFSEGQHQWLVETQQKDAEFAAAAQREQEKNTELSKMAGEIADLQGDLAEASANLTVEWPREKFIKLFERTNRKMKWMEANPDKAVDTVHDLIDDYEADQDAVRELLKLHEKLVEIQTRMKEKTDADGKDLFEPSDITRELWTPLVQANIIPSNAVADEYSQDAQVWNGACEIYQKKLEEHTENTSKYETAQRVLRIGTDVMTLAGSVAAESIKAANFDGMSISRMDKVDLAQANAADTAGTATAGQLETIKTVSAEKLMQRDTARDVLIAQLAFGVVTGGLGVVDQLLGKNPGKNKMVIAEAIYDQISKAALQGLAIGGAQVTATDAGKAFTSDYRSDMNAAQNLVQYGLKAGKCIFRVHDIIVAEDKGGREAAGRALVGAIAGAIGNAFAAFDTQYGTATEGSTEVVQGTQSQWAHIGATIETSIIAAANITWAAKYIYDAQQNGGLKNVDALIGALGLSVLAPIMTGASQKIMDGTTEVVTDTKLGDDGAIQFQQTQTEHGYGRDDISAITGAAASGNQAMNTLASNGTQKAREDAWRQAQQDQRITKDAISKARDELQGVDLSSVREQLQAKAPKGADDATKKEAIAKEIARREAYEKDKAMSEFSQKLAEDPVFKAEFFAAINEQTEREAQELESLIGDTSTSPENLQNDEKAQRAMAAMDKLIREAQSANMRWQVVETLTAGGAAILVAALPAAGLVVAIQKMAMDIAILVRKSIQLNKWVDNMALTAGNNSVYGPAIQGRLHSARVQVSQQSVRIIFDAIGIAAESAKFADSTGVATGVSIGNNMARALTEFGYKIEKEAEIQRGWKLYKKARANPGDRKKARKAMRWNSTLSKCVLAYGIVIDGDPIAKEIARSCGMTPEVLADQSIVCQKVVTYFETLYTDDPVVLRRIPLTKDWHPGSPTLTRNSWVRFKSEAAKRALPPLSEASTKTPGIDKQIVTLEALVGPDGDFAAVRDARFPEIDLASPDGKSKRDTPEYQTFLIDTQATSIALIDALKAYAPVNAEPPEDMKKAWAAGERHDDKVKPWTGGASHQEFVDIIESLSAQAKLLRGEVQFDLKQIGTRKKARAAMQKAKDDYLDAASIDEKNVA